MMTSLTTTTTQRVTAFFFFFFFAGVLLLLGFLNSNCLGHELQGSIARSQQSSEEGGINSALSGNSSSTTTTQTHRKLLTNHRAKARKQPERSWGEKCVASDIVVSQSPTAPLPSGIPKYTVEIMNNCFTGCNISGIHLSCGWFSSDNLISPKIFKRLSYDDCLVNDGNPLVNGGSINFYYSNTYLFPLSVSSVQCP